MYNDIVHGCFEITQSPAVKQWLTHLVSISRGAQDAKKLVVVRRIGRPCEDKTGVAQQRAPADLLRKLCA